MERARAGAVQAGVRWYSRNCAAQKVLFHGGHERKGKVSSKGRSKRQNKLSREQYKSALEGGLLLDTVTNKGMRMNAGVMCIYEQKKLGLGHRHEQRNENERRDDVHLWTKEAGAERLLRQTLDDARRHPHGLDRIIGWFSNRTGTSPLTTGKCAERTKHDFRCPICRSTIGQASCLIYARRRQLTFPFCC